MQKNLFATNSHLFRLLRVRMRCFCWLAINWTLLVSWRRKKLVAHHSLCIYIYLHWQAYLVLMPEVVFANCEHTAVSQTSCTPLSRETVFPLTPPFFFSFTIITSLSKPCDFSLSCEVMHFSAYILVDETRLRQLFFMYDKPCDCFAQVQIWTIVGLCSPAHSSCYWHWTLIGKRRADEKPV